MHQEGQRERLQADRMYPPGTTDEDHFLLLPSGRCNRPAYSW
jgi:hypothetical protein